MNQNSAILLLCIICITVPVIVESRVKISGGVEAEPHEFPFYVALAHPFAMYPFCGGFIINKQWIVTAAHCFIRNPHPANTNALVGIHHLRDVTSSHRYTTSRLIPHELFDENTLAHDIALLQLSRPISFDGNTTNFAYLSTQTSPQVGLMTTVCGFGRKNETHQAETLLKVDVPISDPRRCMRMNPRINFCAGTGNGMDSCMGDSGGPLFIKRDDKFIILGIVSYGPNLPCGEVDPISRGIYLNVAHYLSWIERFTNISRDPVPNSATTVHHILLPYLISSLMVLLFISIFVNM